MLIIKNSFRVFIIFSIVALLAYVFSFQLLFFHTAFEVFYYAGLFFASYVIGSSLIAFFRRLTLKPV